MTKTKDAHEERYEHNGGEVIVQWDGDDRDEGE